MQTFMRRSAKITGMDTMPKAKASEIKLETVKGEARSVVYGPYDVDYGRQQYGSVEKDGREFVSKGTDGREIGRHGRKSEAVMAVVEWAEENLTSDSVLRDFEPVTAGGKPLTFKRRVISHRKTSIVAAYRDEGRWVQTSWGDDGICDICRHPETEKDKRRDEAMRLVPREPVPDVETEQEPSPTPSP